MLEILDFAPRRHGLECVPPQMFAGELTKRSGMQIMVVLLGYAARASHDMGTKWIGREHRVERFDAHVKRLYFRSGGTGWSMGGHGATLGQHTFMVVPASPWVQRLGALNVGVICSLHLQ